MDASIRELRVQKCLHELNPRGWICVPEALRMLHCARNRLESVGVNAAVYSLLPKHRPWYFGQRCDRQLISAVFKSAVEFVFSVDLEVSPKHWLVFRDTELGTVYEVTDKWYDHWFVIIREDSRDDDESSEGTVYDVSDAFAHDMSSLLLLTDEELHV